eukprot:CAMPEP_0178909188 /NCGR_PEP_ID=MMETSP0786-20121207/8355_1 /TAXON_ID=186022 /ORGANISM="Thalassionema frauenfeldii, Strain CCMP 1798" /LENGTH=179 /DNA_ID=CAMNT_0020581205 /DNA_START=55 /DNA_END=591 /DNA_ORIENTATION=-
MTGKPYIKKQFMKFFGAGRFKEGKGLSARQNSKRSSCTSSTSSTSTVSSSSSLTLSSIKRASLMKDMSSISIKSSSTSILSTTSSLSSTTSSSALEKKHVTFQSHVNVRVTLHAKNMTSDEVAKSWYTDEELGKMDRNTERKEEIKRFQHSFSAVQLVMNEQDRQYMAGECNPESIRRA